MMYQKIHKLMNDGIPLLQIIYVNFEDERLLELALNFRFERKTILVFR